MPGGHRQSWRRLGRLPDGAPGASLLERWVPFRPIHTLGSCVPGHLVMAIPCSQVPEYNPFSHGLEEPGLLQPLHVAICTSWTCGCISIAFSVAIYDAIASDDMKACLAAPPSSDQSISAFIILWRKMWAQHYNGETPYYY